MIKILTVFEENMVRVYKLRTSRIDMFIVAVLL
jgi:hypothetical protein